MVIITRGRSCSIACACQVNGMLVCVVRSSRVCVLRMLKTASAAEVDTLSEIDRPCVSILGWPSSVFSSLGRLGSWIGVRHNGHVHVVELNSQTLRQKVQKT
jgi:hypothetical protein